MFGVSKIYSHFQTRGNFLNFSLPRPSIVTYTEFVRANTEKQHILISFEEQTRKSGQQVQLGRIH